MTEDERRYEMTRQKHQTAYVCRTRFERNGATAYIGHLDLMKVFERALKRADLPLLYTQGYNPRPMLVFALPLGVGIETSGDYVDVSLSVTVPAEEFMERLNRELPEGVKALSCINIDEPRRSLMSVVTVATYKLKGRGITRGVIGLFARERLEIEKKSKGKIKTTDIRELLIKITGTEGPDSVEVMVYAGSSRNLRPDSIFAALVKYEGFDAGSIDDTAVERTALYGGEYPDIEGIEGLV
ncbi:MAG: TIGR03936 family radical SAM-associated protein [Clostridiales bacterium]|nr:TIGR03936 family radical SAM-associated protein [Clostridiales bacterium]